MKSIKKLLGIITAALCALFVLAGCNGGNASSSSVQPSDLRLNYDNYRLEIFQSVTLEIEGEYNGNPVWSSDNPDVISVKDGVVTGDAEGSAVISVQVDGVTLTCNVTVMETSDVPMLVFEGIEEISVLVGETYELNAYVLYKGEKYYDATFSCTVENTAFATVEGKTLTAVKAGTTTVYISADWRSYKDSDFLKTSLPLKVNADVLAKINSKSTTLYAIEENLFKYNTTYANSYQLQATVLKGGVAASSENIKWKSSNENVLTVDAAGVVRAVGVGEAQVTVYYEAGNVVCNSAPLTITVQEKPLVDMTRFKPFLIDCFLGNALIEAEDDKITFDFTPYTDGQTVSGIKDAATNAAVAYNPQTQTFTSPAIGEATWLIDTPLYTLKADVICATKVISTASELINLQKYGNLWQKTYPYSYVKTDKDTGEQTTVNEEYIAQNYEGYFVLANNIAFTYKDYTNEEKCFSSAHTHISVNPTTFPEIVEIGFSGTFNGLGNSISGLVTGAGGLFGNIAADGVVKNVTLQNAKMRTALWRTTGVVADVICGTLENVNVHVDFENLNYQDNKSYSAALAYRFHNVTLQKVNVTLENMAAGHNALANYATGGSNKVIDCKISSKQNPLVLVDSIAPFDAFELFAPDVAGSDVTTDDVKWD